MRRAGLQHPLCCSRALVLCAHARSTTVPREPAPSSNSRRAQQQRRQRSALAASSEGIAVRRVAPTSSHSSAPPRAHRSLTVPARLPRLNRAALRCARPSPPLPLVPPRMDRFLLKWKSHADASSSLGRVSPGLALQQEDENEQSDDSMDQFIEDDLDDEEEDDEQEERKETVHRVQTTGQVHKRVKLQLQLAGGSAAAARTKYKPEQPARSTLSAMSSSSSSAAASASSRAATSSAARPAAASAAPSASQPARLSRAQQNAQKLFQPRQTPNTRPVAAAASSAASSSAARPAAAASVSSSQPTRASASASSAAPSLTRAVSAPEPAASQPQPSVAAAAAAAAAPRKRKHLPADDPTPSTHSLVDLIEDSWSDDDESPVGLQPRRSQLQRLLLKPVPRPPSPPPPPARHRSVLSMLHAVQSGTIPFASKQCARIARRREAVVENKEEAATKAKERGEAVEEQVESMVSVGPFSSAASDLAASSSSSAAAASSSSVAAAAPCGSSMPHYASSAFRTSQVRHMELFHHSMKHLLWSRMKPVKDWSLCGEKPAAVAGVPFDRFAPPPPPAALSYVTQLRFDGQGALLCASSNNGLVDLYDFDVVWMAGRRIEKSKRHRELRAREEYHRVANLIRGRPDSPPRSQQKWKLTQPAPVLKPYTSPAPPAHERIRPIFSMNLAASATDASETMSASQRSAQQSPILRQIDTQHWSPSNCNEIALSSQRSNQIYLFDVSRCDEQGSPHRRILLGDSFTPAHASCVMDFVYFPASVGSNGGGGSGSGKTLVAALRNGEINTLDLRVSSGMANTADAPKIFKAQQRATSSAGSNSRPNPPASLQISGCGQKLYVFTEQGMLESWDTRLMRASFERVHLLESLWSESHRHAPDAGPLGMQQAVLGRVCSSSIHPQDDHALLFQLLSGAVGVVDVNPCSPSFQSVRTVVPHSAAFVSSTLEDQFSLRPKRTAVFLRNGQSGTNASAKRERIIAAADLESQLRIIGQDHSSSHRSSGQSSVIFAR